MVVTPPVRVTAPTSEAARHLARSCDGLTCSIDRDGDGWQVTIDRAGSQDGTVGAVLDTVQRWLRDAGVPGARIELGDQTYVMKRE